MHLVSSMGEPGSLEERFIDVFRGGQLLTRCGAFPLLCSLVDGPLVACVWPVSWAFCVSPSNSSHLMKGKCLAFECWPRDVVLASTRCCAWHMFGGWCFA